MARKSVNTTIDNDLYKKIQILAIKLDKRFNDLIEEGMKLVIEKHKDL